MNSDKNVPEIRFREFIDVWHQKNLSSQVKLENGFAFKSKYFKKNPTNVIVLTPGSVNIGGGFQAGKGQYYDVSKDVSSKYEFKPGDVFVTMTDLTPTAQALGFPAFVPNDENTYLHNQRLGKLVEFEGNVQFLYSLLCTQKRQKEVVSTSSGTTVKHTSPSKFLSRDMFFPCKQEQTQIGNYFQQLDSLINQHQQKHDKLSNLKKAMLEKMFPKAGESVPEIRFEGFIGDWLNSSIGEISGATFGGGTPSTRQERFWQGDIPWIQSSDIIDGTISSVTGKKLITKKAVSQSATKLVPENSIAVVTRVGVGKLSLMKREYATSQDFLSLSDLKIDAQYSAYAIWRQLQREKHQVQGTSIKGLTKEELLSKLISYPEAEEEQKKIGDYFRNLDVLINQNSQQITKLKNIKQACLDKMFV